MVGLTNNRSIQDEKLVEALFTSHLGDTKAHGATATNIIVDARPTTNAMAQRAQGAGTENMDNYPGCQKVYLGIENIHVVRDAYTRVVDAVGFGNTPGSQVDRVAVGRSGYLKHIAVILSGTLLTVRNIHVHSSHVLVHCSDVGWTFHCKHHTNVAHRDGIAHHKSPHSLKYVLILTLEHSEV